MKKKQRTNNKTKKQQQWWLLVSAQYARPSWHFSFTHRRLAASRWPVNRSAPARTTAAFTLSGNGTFWIRTTAPSVNAPRKAPRVPAPSARLYRRRASMSATIPPTAAPGARRSAVSTEEWSTTWDRTSRWGSEMLLSARELMMVLWNWKFIYLFIFFIFCRWENLVSL